MVHGCHSLLLFSPDPTCCQHAAEFSSCKDACDQVNIPTRTHTHTCYFLIFVSNSYIHNSLTGLVALKPFLIIPHFEVRIFKPNLLLLLHQKYLQITI